MKTVQITTLAILLMACPQVCGADLTIVKMFEFADSSFGAQTAVESQHGVFFAGDDGAGNEIYYTDGFRTLTWDLNPNGRGIPHYMGDFRDDFYLSAQNANQRSWYTFDGHDLQVFERSDDTQPVGFSPLFHYDNKLYVQADGPNGFELFSYDGDTFEEVADLKPGPGSSFPFLGIGAEGSDFRLLIAGPKDAEPGAAFDSENQFFAFSKLGVKQITDTSYSGETLLYMFGDSVSKRSVATDDYIYFRFNDGSGGSLVAASREGLHHISRIHPRDSILQTVPTEMTAIGDDVYFVARSDKNLFYLFRARGTELERFDDPQQVDHLHVVDEKLFIQVGNNGVFTVGDDDALVYVGPGVGGYADLDGAIGYDGSLYFRGTTGSDPKRQYLFKTDGVATKKVGDLEINDIKRIFTSPFGVFLDDGVSIVFSDGESDTHRIDRFLRQDPDPEAHSSPSVRSFESASYGGAFFFRGEDEDGVGWFKIVPSDSIARVDMNANGEVDVGDIDLMTSYLADGESHLVFDFDDSGSVDMNDRTTLIHEFANTTFGDTNLDGFFDSTDL